MKLSCLQPGHGGEEQVWRKLEAFTVKRCGWSESRHWAAPATAISGSRGSDRSTTHPRSCSGAKTDFTGLAAPGAKLPFTGMSAPGGVTEVGFRGPSSPLMTQGGH